MSSEADDAYEFGKESYDKGVYDFVNALLEFNKHDYFDILDEDIINEIADGLIRKNRS